MSKMNLPNKLTILRVLLVPFFVAPFYLPMAGTDKMSYNALAALGFFVAASLTDMLDGQIARSQNLVTTFGKFLDPLADKILTTTALLIFLEKQVFIAIPVIIILSREFMVSGLRLVTANEGVVVPAGFMGKLKTVVTMATIIGQLIIMTFRLEEMNLGIIIQILLWVSVFLTVVSGFDYLKACAPYIRTDDNDDEEDFEIFDENKNYGEVDDNETN